jgi:hypothetical protein
MGAPSWDGHWHLRTYGARPRGYAGRSGCGNPPGLPCEFLLARRVIALEGATPHLFRPRYAGANLVHPSYALYRG